MTNATRPRIDGSLALQLDFGDLTTTTFPAARPVKASLTRRPRQAVGRGLLKDDKYSALEHRRRQAQIAARKALGLF
jgi:hypothetical protein